MVNNSEVSTSLQAVELQSLLSSFAAAPCSVLEELKEIAKLTIRSRSEASSEAKYGSQLQRFAASSSNLIQDRKVPQSQHLDSEMLRQIIALQNAFDPLTGLHSRASLLEQLQWRIDHDQEHARSYALLFIDIDGFKRINDSLGHLTGDALLLEVANRLEQTVQAVPHSIVSRIGGDEFVVLMSDVADEADAVTYAIALEYLLRTPINCGRQQAFISASVGVAFGAPAAYTDAEQMLEDADVAMYCAKRAGKAQCVVFSQAMREEAKSRLLLEVDLRDALRENQFTVHYQPKVRLGTGAVKGFEALLRWHHPKRGMVSPLEFIPIAEEAGLISQIGRWVARQAIQQLVEWRRKGIVSLDATMAVNVSTRQFHEADLLDYLRRELLTADLPSECLVLEVTESVLVQDSRTVLALLQNIVNAGIGLDLDDFGTGYSSLSYLHKFPFRSIKIDRSFVQQMSTEPQSIGLVASIVGLAKSLRMGAIAEGVETEAQAAQLRKLGCGVAQGYLFSAPKSAHEIETLLLERGGLLGPRSNCKVVKFPLHQSEISAGGYVEPALQRRG